MPVIILIIALLIPSISFASYSSRNLVSGGTSGTTLNQSDYEFGTSLIQTGVDTILMFNKVGSDATAPAPGTIAMQIYTISTDTWGSSSIIFDPTAGGWYVRSFIARIKGTQIYLYIFETNAAQNAGQITLIKSTDLTGSTWGAETVIRASTAAIPAPAGYIHTSDPGVDYLVISNDTTGQNLNLMKTIDGGETFTQGPIIYTAGGFAEASFVYIGNQRMIGVLRTENDYLYMTKSADDGVTWSTPVSTGLGQSTGTKVTPRIELAVGHPNRVVVYFYDRGPGGHYIGGPTNIDDAFNNKWLPLYRIGLSAQGNGGLIGYDAASLRYLVIGPKEINAGLQTSTSYWIWKDIYNNTKF